MIQVDSNMLLPEHLATHPLSFSHIIQFQGLECEEGKARISKGATDADANQVHHSVKLTPPT